MLWVSILWTLDNRSDWPLTHDLMHPNTYYVHISHILKTLTSGSCEWQAIHYIQSVPCWIWHWLYHKSISIATPYFNSYNQDNPITNDNCQCLGRIIFTSCYYSCYSVITKQAIIHCFVSCSWGHVDVVKYLVSEAQCNPNVENKNGYTPLHHACEWVFHDVLMYLRQSQQQ